MSREIISYVRIDGPTSTLVDIDNNTIQDNFNKIPVIYYTEQPTHKLRLLHTEGDPYTLAELQAYTGWDFAIAEDYSGATVPPVRTQAGITITEETWTDTGGTERTGGVVNIPLDANTTELQTILGTEPFIYNQDDSPEGRTITVGTELLGFVAPEVEPSLIVQYPFVFRNRRITSATPPGTVGVDYLTPAQIEALYMAKVPGAVLGNLPVFNALGGLDDSGLTPAGAPPVENVYADIATMIADQGNQTTDYIQQAGTEFYKKTSASTADISDYNQIGGGDDNIQPVQNAYADTTAMIAGQGDQTSAYLQKAGTEYYEYLGTTVGDITDYQLVGGGASGGDVTGTTLSTTGNVTGYSDTTGKNIKDLGFALEKNTDFDLIEFTTEDGCKLKFNFDSVIPFYNDTGATIPAGTVLHLVGATNVGGQIITTFEKAIASDWEKIQGTMGICACDVINGVTGHVAIRGQFKGIDTSGFAQGVQLWLSATTAGAMTTSQPQFPDYTISVGGTATSAVDGEVLINFTSSYTDTYHEAWDGAIRETFDFRVDATGGVITGTLKNVNTSRNLTCFFSDGFFTLDTTTADLGITLTAGTDEAVQTNYVYIPIETKVLTVSTVEFPVTEHCRVAVIDCQSASDIEAKGGARGNQNTNDHIKKETDNGHILHITEWIRRQFATIDPRDGCEVTLDDTAGNGYITMTSGKVSQMHLQTVDSISMPTSSIMIANDPDTPFIETSNLNTITKFSDGSAWNDWGKIVVWLIANKGGEPSFLLVNLPRKGENSSEKAMLDEKQRADYSIPIEYKSKAVLLGAFAVEIDGGVLTYEDDYQDLRGTIPSNIAGGGGAGGGVTSFLGLSDVPSSFVGQAGKLAVVNDSETALEFKNVGYTPPVTTNAVADTDALTADTVTNTLAADGTVTVLDSPTHGTKYWLYVSGTATGTITNVTGTTIVPTVTIVDKVFCIEYDTISSSYKPVR